MRLMIQMVAAAILSAVTAILFRDSTAVAYIMKEVGTIFVSLLKMVVVPIAFISIAAAIIRLGGGWKTCGVSIRATGLMVGMSIFGVALGLALMTAIGIPDFTVNGAAAKEAKAPTILSFIVGCIPTNPIKSFAEGNMLQVITFAFFTGAASLLIPQKETVGKVLEAAQAILIKITGFVIAIAPIGVYALLYPVFVKSMAGLVLTYVYMILALIIGSLVYMAICCYPVVKTWGSISPADFFKTVIQQDIIGAISGGASNYMAPRIANLKKNTSIPAEIIDFLIPITSILMRSGSCICVGIYTVFAASVYGVDLTPDKIAVILFLTVIALTAAPGIIGGTLMDCAIVWAAVGIPLEAVALLAGIDYLMDVIRTVLNIHGGEVVTACVSGRKEQSKMVQCFLCHKKMDEKMGLCTNPKCVRSKPIAEKAEVKEGDKVKANESE